MARKELEAPVTLSRREAKFLAQIKATGTLEGSEVEFERYLTMSEEHAVSIARLDAADKIVNKGADGGSSSHPHYAKFKKALDTTNKAMQMEFRAFDAWQAKVKKIASKVNVSEDDLRAIVFAALEESSLLFTANLVTLTTAIVRVIKGQATEHESGTIPLCSDCR